MDEVMAVVIFNKDKDLVTIQVKFDEDIIYIELNNFDGDDILNFLGCKKSVIFIYMCIFEEFIEFDSEVGIAGVTEGISDG